ncbi:MAG: histidine kinase [Burkholderiaceae bacterium]|nr:histidine kinase [Burkholderiaceae bacterium]
MIDRSPGSLEAATPDLSLPPAAAVGAPAGVAALPPRRRLTDGADFPVVPDCCNVGTVARVLVPLNLCALLVVWLAQASASPPWSVLETVLHVNATAAASLLLLCVARRFVNGARRPVQWAVALGVPALLTVAVSFVDTGSAPWPTLRESLLSLAPRVLGAVALAWVFIEFLRLRQLSLQPSQAEGRLQALQARIRPHFLFNSLNTVLGLMRSDPRKAERTLENLADLFRVFMKDSRELVPLDDEVLLCKEYLTIEKLRLADRLAVRWEIDDMPGDALLPSLLLQPLVENAVHHGIEPSAGRGEIVISVSRSGDRVRVEIVNPVPESAPRRVGNHMALSNVRERLDLTFDVEGQLEASSADGRFRVTVQFPYRKERRRRDVRRSIDPDR